MCLRVSSVCVYSHDSHPTRSHNHPTHTHTHTHTNTYQDMRNKADRSDKLLQEAEAKAQVCCSVLKCVAVCCSVLCLVMMSLRQDAEAKTQVNKWNV